MKHTKGELKTGISNTLIYAEGTRIADVLVGGISHEKCEANAEHFVECWNAFEEGGLVSDLLAALEDLVFHVSNDGIPWPVLKEKVKAAKQVITKANTDEV